MGDPSSISLSEAARRRTNNYDAMRFVLAALVICSHSYTVLQGADNDLIYRLSRHQTFAGGIAVESFFVISGFLVTASWLNSRGAIDFLRKRILRIYPGFVLNAIACVCLFGWLTANVPGEYWSHVSPRHFITGVVTLGDSAPTDVLTSRGLQSNINVPIWTVRVEFECYLLAMVCGLAGLYRKRSRFLGLAAGVVALFGFCVLFESRVPHFLLWSGHLRLGSFFLVGALCYVYRDRITVTNRMAGLAALVWFGTMLTVGHRVVSPICLPVLLFWIAYHLKLRLHNWARHGDMSYGIYLYGWPVQMLIAFVAHKQIEPWQLTLLALPSTIVLAFISWHVVEHPFLRLKRRAASVPPATLDTLPEPAVVSGQ